MAQPDDPAAPIDAHFLHSTLRERIAEHVFVGDLLRRLWQCGVVDVEILRSEFDAGGYDLVLGRGRVLRHIQFKSSRLGGRAAGVKVSVRLGEKPSGCVVWMVVRPDLTFDRFLWFGGAPGAPLPSLDGCRMAKHTKGNSKGVKLLRPDHRIVPRGRFTTLGSLDLVVERLFGAQPDIAAAHPSAPRPPRERN